MEGLSDALYQSQVALRAAKQELNEWRDANLNEAEVVALLDAYTKAGR